MKKNSRDVMGTMLGRVREHCFSPARVLKPSLHCVPTEVGKLPGSSHGTSDTSEQ